MFNNRRKNQLHSCANSKSQLNRQRSIYSKTNQSLSNKSTKNPDCISKGKQRTDVQDYVTYLKAFALIYVMPPEDWTAEIIDKLLQERDEYFQICSEEDEDNEFQENGDCSIRRSFKMNGNSFTLELKPSYSGAEKKAVHSPPHTVRHIRKVLQVFFQTANYCLLSSSVVQLLIWVRHDRFHVMDVRKNLVTAQLTVAMLVSLCSIENLELLISNLIGVHPNEKFSVRELVVVRLVTPDGRIFVRDANKRTIEYRTINKYYAYLRSSLHLSLNPDAQLSERCSCLVAVAAILASKIDPPAAWNTKKLDELICFGVDYCFSHWNTEIEKYQLRNLDHFPKELRVGQFLVDFKLIPEVCGGLLSLRSVLKNTDFELEIRKGLRIYGNVLFQINNQVYGVWSKNNFYYLLDPYRHTVVTSLKIGDVAPSQKWATLRMFRNFHLMLSVFHELLRESNRGAPFFIHVIHIKNIKDCSKDSQLQIQPTNDSIDAISLNESINFPKELSSCAQFLSEISDYELDIPREKEEMRQKLEDSKVTVEGTSQEFFDFESSLPEHWKDLLQERSSGLQNSNWEPKDSLQIVDSSTSLAGKSLPTIPAGTSSFQFYEEANRTIKQDTIRHSTTLHASKTGSTSTARKSTVWKAKASIDLTTQSSVMKASRSREQTGNQQQLPTDPQSPSRKYPGYAKKPKRMSIVGSESGTMASLEHLLDAAFHVANRVFTMTPWGNYVIFRHPAPKPHSKDTQVFYLFDGCVCNIDRFRHLDLSCGTEGLLPFHDLSQAICHMIDSRESRQARLLQSNLGDCCSRFEKFLCRGGA